MLNFVVYDDFIFVAGSTANENVAKEEGVQQYGGKKSSRPVELTSI
jgi:hypothetical protein